MPCEPLDAPDDLRKQALSQPYGISLISLRPSRARAATIPVIAVTASAMTQDRKTIMAAGFDGYQSKPLNVKAFIEAVRQMLDR